MVKKILLLSCGTGEGHNSAAHAIKDALHERGIECEIRDPVSFKSEGAKKRVSALYNNIIKKTPRIFGVVYKIGGAYEKTRLLSPVYFANGLYAKKLDEYIKAESFDAVICTHLYGMEALTVIKKKNNTVPCFGVMTDYTCIPFMAETKLDMYFIPAKELEKEFISRGMPAEKLVVTGIPTAPRFSERLTKAEARQRLGMPENARIYLAATGGVGCEKMLSCIESIKKVERGNYCIYVLTGRNEAMREHIEKKYKNKHVIAVPFTKEVNVYMNAADVMLSKSGGLSSTEAAVANIPLVHVHAIPGCETKNYKFFVKKGMSVYAKNSDDAAKQAYELVSNSEKNEKMRENQRKYINPNAARDILDNVLRICGGEK